MMPVCKMGFKLATCYPNRLGRLIGALFLFGGYHLVSAFCFQKLGHLCSSSSHCGQPIRVCGEIRQLNLVRHLVRQLQNW